MELFTLLYKTTEKMNKCNTKYSTEKREEHVNYNG
jgi:hypothetical protein